MSLRSASRYVHQASRAMRHDWPIFHPSFRPLFTPRPCRMLTMSAVHPAALAEHPPAQPTVLLVTPSTKYIEEEELDVELLPSQNVHIVITDRAAEVCLWN